MARYDRIGQVYAQHRKPDPRWSEQIHAALGDAERIINVGAGTGNYEPTNRQVVAVEPSAVMIAQRPAGPVVQGVAEALPVPDQTFDAAMGLLTAHHWSDVAAGLNEMARVAKHQILMIFEPEISHQFWLLDYFPSGRHSSTEVNAPTEASLRQHCNVIDVQVMAVPAGCTDGVAAAHWDRPERYLDAGVQASISLLAMLPEDVRAAGTARLSRDLESGAWDAKHGHLRAVDAHDFGYRLVTSEGLRNND